MLGEKRRKINCTEFWFQLYVKCILNKYDKKIQQNINQILQGHRTIKYI